MGKKTKLIKKKKALKKSDKKVMVEGRHPFFENSHRVGADGLGVPIVFYDGSAFEIKLYELTAKEIEALYYVSLDMIGVKRLSRLKPELSALKEKLLLHEAKGKTIMGPFGPVFIYVLQALKAIPDE